MIRVKKPMTQAGQIFLATSREARLELYREGGRFFFVAVTPWDGVHCPAALHALADAIKANVPDPRVAS